MDHDDSTRLAPRPRGFEHPTRSATPVLGLTRRGDLKSKLKAFDLGVDDILAMPFSPEELLARSIVITRRATGLDRPIVPTIKLGEIEIDILNRQVLAGESVVHLSGIEQSLLYLLASRGGQVVTRDEILDAIWGTDFVAESNIVDRHVAKPAHQAAERLRRPDPRFIATVPVRDRVRPGAFEREIEWRRRPGRAEPLPARSRAPITDPRTIATAGCER